MDKNNIKLSDLDNKYTETRLNSETINKEELTIEDLHKDLESKLAEEGFMFDRRKFIFQDRALTFEERVADRVAKFGGSWGFMILFGIFIIGWIISNAILLSNRGLDPYPFLLLNIMLSCIAAIQAPIIMMSQNRQEAREKKQQEILVEKDIVDFKQDRLDLILDQKEWEILKDIYKRIKNIEAKLAVLEKKGIRKRK